MSSKPRKNSSRIWSLSLEEFTSVVKSSQSIGQILKHFNLSNKGGNSNTVKRRILAENINMSHIRLGKGSNLGRKFGVSKIRRSYEECFSEHSNVSRTVVRKTIIRDKLLPYACQECDNKAVWNNKSLSLQLEHKNGVSNDNRLENLCFLCPNCHSQTSTFAGKNRNPKPKAYKDRSVPKTWLRKVERPSKDNLEKLMEQYPMTVLGKMYGVTDNAVRKWVKSYGINKK